MATGSSDMTIRLWDTLEGNPRRLLHGHRGMVMAVAFSPDGTYLASSGGHLVMFYLLNYEVVEVLH